MTLDKRNEWEVGETVLKVRRIKKRLSKRHYEMTLEEYRIEEQDVIRQWEKEIGRPIKAVMPKKRPMTQR